MYISFSKKISKLINNSGILEHKVTYVPYFLRMLFKNSTILFWKSKRNRIKKYSTKYQLPIIQLEDAFIGYIQNIKKQIVNIGLYFDRTGVVYYEKDKSDIICRTIINRDYKEKDLQLSEELINKIATNKITKYNFLEWKNFSFDKQNSSILLIDQVKDDFSLVTNSYGKVEFKKMYKEALKYSNGKKIYIKCHPMGGGHLEEIYDPSESILIKGQYNIYQLFKYFTKVFTVSSQCGFEALLAGKEVYCFGISFYSGYGLTNDYVKHQKLETVTDIRVLFYASYIKSCKYHIAGVECSLEEMIDVIIENNRLVNKDSKVERFFLYKVPAWKLPAINGFIFQNCKNYKKVTQNFNFLQKQSNALINVSSIKALTKYSPTENDRVVLWGFKGEQDQLKNYTENNSIPIITFEDGFIRSVGLGSNFVTPYSFVLDECGIYYDPTHKSAIEYLLENTKPTKIQLERTKKILSKLKEMNISKYNLSYEKQFDISKIIKEKSKNKKIILIPGQVSDDMSLLKGGLMIGSYRDLIPKIRQEHPHAFIMYKHHPDVLSGNRRGYISHHILKKHVDFILKNENIIDLIKICDEVHTITSLTGFEALLHNKKVVHYGMPFYGGYGFTNDMSGIKNKRTKISFLEFCYVGLIIYPRYVKLGLNIALTPEIILKLIEIDRNNIKNIGQNILITRIYQILRIIKLSLQKIYK